jgi:hypothetical protein
VLIFSKKVSHEQQRYEVVRLLNADFLFLLFFNLSSHKEIFFFNIALSLAGLVGNFPLISDLRIGQDVDDFILSGLGIKSLLQPRATKREYGKIWGV